MTIDQDPPQEPFEYLARLKEDDWLKLEERVLGLSRLSRYDHLLDAVRDAIEAPEESASDLIDDLLAVQDDMRAEGQSAARVAHALAEQLGLGADSPLGDRLARLLEAPALRHVAKARSALSATPRRVNKVKLSTEIRPLAEQFELADMCVLVHDLRLTFDVDGRTAALNFTLDPPMLRDLWAELVKGLTMEQQLRDTLAGVLDVFDPEGDAGEALGHGAAFKASLTAASAHADAIDSDK